MGQRAKWNDATKCKVALETYKSTRSVTTEIAEEHRTPPLQVHLRK